MALFTCLTVFKLYLVLSLKLDKEVQNGMLSNFILSLKLCKEIKIRGCNMLRALSGAQGGKLTT